MSTVTRRGRRAGASLRLMWLSVFGALTVCLGCGEPGIEAPGGDRELAENRLYDGAPPTIPHAVDELSRHDCLACHLEGDARDGEAQAKATPHPELERCEQCHLVTGEIALFQASDYTAPGPYPTGWLGQPLGPPLIPHPLTMRENCVGCHGPGGDPTIRTSHPERDRCQQCHLPAHEGWPGPRPDWR